MTPTRLKEELVQVRMSTEEKEKLDALADQAKMSRSGFLRHLINITPLKK